MLNLFVNTAHAAVSLPNFNQQDLPAFISSVYSFSLTILGLAIFVQIIRAGFKWFTAAGNAGKSGEATKMIKNAIIGAILLLASYLILNVINPDLVKNTFKFNLPPSSSVPAPVAATQTPQTAGPLQITGTNTPSPSGFLDKFINKAKAAGIYSFDVRVVDANGNGCTKTYNIEVVANTSSFTGSNKVAFAKSHYTHDLFDIANADTSCAVVDLGAGIIPTGVEGMAYYAEIPATGGKVPYVYSITNGSLPPGLSVTANLSGGGTVTVGGTPVTTGEAGPSIGFIRTLRLTITKPGPISIREVEIYDTSGAKLPAGKIRASSNVSEASKVLDGNPDTVWTASGGSAWILFDLDLGKGSAHSISKVKVMPGNNSASGTIQAMVTAAGADDPTGGPFQYTFQPLGSYMPYPDAFLVRGVTTPVDTWKAPFKDGVFLEYPPLSYAGKPTVSFTVNGRKSIDANKNAGVNGEKIIYSWTSTNADYVTVTGSAVPNPAVTFNLSADDSRICAILNDEMIKTTFTTRSHPMPVNGSAEGAQYVNGCGGFIFTYTITAGQRSTGKTASDNVITKLNIPGTATPASGTGGATCTPSCTTNHICQPDPTYNKNLYGAVTCPAEKNVFCPLGCQWTKTDESCTTTCTGGGSISAACTNKFSAEQTDCINSGFYAQNGYCNYSDQALAMNCGQTGGAGKAKTGFCLPDNISQQGCLPAYPQSQLCSALGIAGASCK